jgi:hypothetical protein
MTRNDVINLICEIAGETDAFDVLERALAGMTKPIFADGLL